MLSVLAISDPAVPKISGTVVWGFLPGASEVTVSGSGATDGAAETSDGAFLRVAGPDAHAAGARVEGGGHAVQLRPSADRPAFGKRFRFRFPTLIAGTATVEAPAPDPAGGPRWGVAVAQTKEGTPCAAGPTRVVDGRGGAVDLRLGVFTEMTLAGGSCRPLNTKPSTERPCDIGTGFGNAEEIEGVDEFLDRARVERRLLAGRATIWAQCGADVERVTLKTPRDIRTLTPSPVGHVILAVYDGDFVDGDLTITAHLKGGRSWTEHHPLGMF
jgi:hypothetical protein